MILKTNKFLLASSIIIGLTFLFATFWESMGLGNKQTITLAFAMIIAFILNIVGLIFGFMERKNDKRKSTVGLIGNSILIFLFFLISISALMTKQLK